VPSLMRIVPAGILAAVIILSTAACGSARSGASGVSPTPAASPLAGLTANQIIQKALNDLTTASSVRVVGKGANSGENFAFDLTDVAAHGCQGTMTMTRTAASPGDAGTGAFDLIEADGTGYVKISQGYLKSVGAPASALAELNGKYLKVTSASVIAEFGPFCDLSDLAKDIAKKIPGFAKAGTATVDGRPVLAFKRPNNAADGTVYISDSDTPEIVSFSGPAREGSYDFTNYNARATITAPPSGDVVVDSNLAG